jgi:diguanylate cyclase (GGDEF)-like protein/PAS domain S-box-containing protein
MVSINDINFRILTYEVNAGIYVSDPEGTFIYANLALADIFDVEHPRDIVRKNFKDFIAPDSANSFMNQFRKSMASGSDAKLISTQILRGDGNIAHVEVHAMPFIKNKLLEGNQGVVYDITRLKQAQDKMMYTSTHDPLTGIYNRTFFEAEMKRLERGRQFPISMMVVNIAGSNILNQPGNQTAGDKLFIRIARQLFYAYRGDDIVARIGENDFAVLLPNVDEKTVIEIGKRVAGDLQIIKRHENEPALQFFIGASTAKEGESLAIALNKAETIAHLKRKNANLNQ